MSVKNILLAKSTFLPKGPVTCGGGERGAMIFFNILSKILYAQPDICNMDQYASTKTSRDTAARYNQSPVPQSYIKFISVIRIFWVP